jgi:hypothetical protein
MRTLAALAPVLALLAAACSTGVGDQIVAEPSPVISTSAVESEPRAVTEIRTGQPTFDVTEFDQTIGFGFFGGSGPDPEIPNYGQLLARDAIRPIYDPEFLSADAARISGGELVIGLVVGDDARAYPVGILRFRKIVNDVVGGTPVLVTW